MSEEPDYLGFDKFISKYANKSSAEQMQGLAEGSKKFNIGKTEAKQLLHEKVAIVEAAGKAWEKQKANQKKIADKKKGEKVATAAKKKKAQAKAKEKLKIEEEKAEKKAATKKIRDAEKAKVEEAKEKKRQAKEEKRLEKKAEAEADKIQKKLLLDEIDVTWETCSDELFQEVCEVDWKKGKFYYGKRVMKENTYEVEGEEVCGIKTFKDNGDIIIYNEEEGIYSGEADIYLSAEIERRLGEKAINLQVKEILSSIQRQTYYDREELENQPKNLRPVGNGIWDITKKELISFSPKYVYINKNPHNHISTAQCPKFKKFLGEVLEEEKERLVAQEWMGYCLLNDVRFEKALLLYGDGENGKSLLCNVIRYFLGRKNCASISLQYLESNPFAPARLFGKSANIFADLPKKALSQTSVFKMTVSGDPISGEKKGKDSFEFTPYLKQMFSCNEPPRTPDRTRGFFRKWLILNFKQHFPEGDPRRDENLFEKLKTSEEMEGILIFALEGLYRLIEQKGFTQHMTRKEVEEFWVRHSDSVAAFILDIIGKDLAEEEKKSTVYETYEAYCTIKGYPAEEQNHFWKRFKEIVDCEEYQPKNDAGYQVRAIKGIKLKSLNLISAGKGVIQDAN